MSRVGRALRPAVFLDRDGTIIEDRGDVSDPSQVVLFPDTIASLQRLRDEYDLFIVTHQPGVARGVMSIQDVEFVNAYVVRHLAEAGVRIVATYVCPHERGDGCLCIQPNPTHISYGRRPRITVSICDDLS
ncbi:MAG: HAD-IIIA family hydrolase [Phycisphaerales bacterium]|nr:HAD-IIIA family hydrolase [Phycisphaerales bacterium]